LALNDKGEGKLPKLTSPSSAKAAMLERRDSNQEYKSQLVSDRAKQIAAGMNFRREKGARVRNIQRIESWHCCPSSWFQTRHDETKVDLYFIRHQRTASSSFRGILWRWAQQRDIPIVSNYISLNQTNNNKNRNHFRLVDARISWVEFQNIASIFATKVFLKEEPIFMTLLRDPLVRAISLFYWSHSRPESVQTSRYSTPRAWRRETRGHFSKEHSEHCEVFAQQSDDINILYAISPQFEVFGRSPEEASEVLRKYHVMIGLTEKFDEFVIMVRRRLGIRTIKELIYMSANHYRHPQLNDWPQRLVTLLNNSFPVNSDQKFMNKARAQYMEQVNSFGASRLATEVKTFSGMLDDMRGHCDLRDLENRASRHFMPPCSHHCEGHAKVHKCFHQRFDEKHSVTAVRSAANKLRSFGGMQAVPHTPLEI